MKKRSCKQCNRIFTFDLWEGVVFGKKRGVSRQEKVNGRSTGIDRCCFGVSTAVHMGLRLTRTCVHRSSFYYATTRFTMACTSLTGCINRFTMACTSLTGCINRFTMACTSLTGCINIFQYSFKTVLKIHQLPH